MIQLADVEAAAARVAGAIRHTPMTRPAPTMSPLSDAGEVTLKLECLQVTGSFKARGAISKLRTLTAEQVARGVVTASGGNHGIAVAYAGRMAGTTALIYVPSGVSPAKAAKIKAYGADLRVEGTVWDEANRHALDRAAEGVTYFHPFADPAVIAGQGTLALEILADAPATDTILVAIGGGGLISGIAVAAKALKPSIRIVGVQATGAPSVHASLAAGRIVELDKVTTKVPTLAAKKTEPVNFEIIRRLVERIVLVDDEALYAASTWLWRELNVAADPSGAATVAALRARAYVPAQGERVCALVCGAGAEGISPPP